MHRHGIVSPAEIIVWGNGCEASHRTHIICSPDNDEVRLHVDIAGPKMTFADSFTVPAPVFRDLLARVDEIRKEMSSGQQADSTDIGNVTVKAKIQSGEIDYREADDLVKLTVLGNLVLDLLHALGVPVIPDLHPIQ